VVQRPAHGEVVQLVRGKGFQFVTCHPWTLSPAAGCRAVPRRRRSPPAPPALRSVSAAAFGSKPSVSMSVFVAVIAQGEVAGLCVRKLFRNVAFAE
jgi:hypothetical protein